MEVCLLVQKCVEVWGQLATTLVFQTRLLTKPCVGHFSGTGGPLSPWIHLSLRPACQCWGDKIHLLYMGASDLNALFPWSHSKHFVPLAPFLCCYLLLCILFIYSVCVCAPEFMRTICMQVPKEAQGVLFHGTELQNVVNLLVWVLRNEPRSFARTVNALNHQAFFLSPSTPPPLPLI